MKELFGQKKNIWLFVLAIFIVLVLISVLVLPKLFISMVSSNEVIDHNEVDYHSTLTFNLNNQGKMEELETIFSDVYSSDNFNKVNVVITDVPQKNKINWVDDKGKVINHLGYDAVVEGNSLNIYLYNNTSAFSYRGWDVDKIAKENEILLIKALMYYRGWPTEKFHEEAKKIFVDLHGKYPEPLFLMTYDL